MHRNFSKDSLEDIKRFNTFVIILLKTTYKRHKHSLQLAEKCRSTVLRLFWPFSHTEARKTCLSSYRKASRRKRAGRWSWWQITLKEALMLVTQRHWTNVEAWEPAKFLKNLGTFSSFPLTGREALSLWFLTEGFSALLSGICALRPCEKILIPDPYARTKHGIFASIVLVLGSLHQISEAVFSGI